MFGPSASHTRPSAKSGTCSPASVRSKHLRFLRFPMSPRFPKSERHLFQLHKDFKPENRKKEKTIWISMENLCKQNQDLPENNMIFSLKSRTQNYSKLYQKNAELSLGVYDCKDWEEAKLPSLRQQAIGTLASCEVPGRIFQGLSMEPKAFCQCRRAWSNEPVKTLVNLYACESGKSQFWTRNISAAQLFVFRRTKHHLTAPQRSCNYNCQACDSMKTTLQSMVYP